MTLPWGIDRSPAATRGRDRSPFRRRVPLYSVLAIQVGQQGGGAILDAADLLGEHGAVEPAWSFGLDLPHEPLKLSCKREKLFFNEIARRREDFRLVFVCGLTHRHKSHPVGFRPLRSFHVKVPGGDQSLNTRM